MTYPIHFASPGADRSKCGAVSSREFLGVSRACWSPVTCPECLEHRDRRVAARAAKVPAPVHCLPLGTRMTPCGLRRAPDYSSVPPWGTRDWSAVTCKTCLRDRPVVRLPRSTERLHAALLLKAWSGSEVSL